MAVGDAHVFPGFLTPVLTQFFFSKSPTTFLTCFCRGERQNSPERKSASSGDRTHNHQVISPTRPPLSHPGGAFNIENHSIVLRQDTLEPKPATGETQERHEYARYRHDMTEIMLN